MRLINTLAALASLLSFSASAQSTTHPTVHYYNYNWEKSDLASARYYSVADKKDSLWHQQDYYFPEKTMQMDGTFKDSASKIKHGRFTYFYDNKKVEATGVYENNNKQGPWLRYHDNGMLADSVFYVKGQVTGTRMEYHKNGYLADSAVMNEDGSGVQIGWYDNGFPSYSGRYSAKDKKNGKWQFFHQNGKLSALETYDNGTIISRQYYDESGNALPDTANKDKAAEFTGGIKEWVRYLQKNLNPNVPVVNGAPVGKYTVIILFTVDTDGTTTDIKPLTRFGYGMEQEAMRMIRNTPKWQPAVDHGRTIKAYRKQPITFFIGVR